MAAITTMGKRRRTVAPRDGVAFEGYPHASSSAFAFAVLALLAGLVYANALSNQFVFDDYDLVVDEPQIRSLTKIPEILGLGDERRRYRPVRFVSYSFDYFFFELDPRGYHLFNLLYHVLNAFLVYLIVRRLVKNPRVSLLAAVLFVVHPIQTDAVTYISGRRDVLSTLFYLAGFYAFLRYRAGTRATVRAAYLALVFIALVLGLFTKEMVVTLPIMMLAHDWYRLLPSSHARIDLSFLRSMAATLVSVIRTYARLYVPILTVAGLFVIEKLLINNPSRMEGLYGTTYVLHFLTMCRVFTTYVGLLCFPVTMNADYSYNAFPVTTSLFDPVALGALLLMALLALGWLKMLQRHKDAAFGGLWFFVTLLPVSQIAPHHELMAEHYLYLPSVGFCLLAALGFEKLLASERTRSVATAVLGILVLALSVRTVMRNRDWRDNVTLWEKTVLTAPNSSRAHDNLGTAYARQGQFRKAIVHFEEALAISPQNFHALHHMGDAYYATEKLDQARTAYHEAIRWQGDDAEIHFSLGRVLGQLGEVDEARSAFQRAVRIRPGYARAHHELATAYYRQGLVEQARDQYLKVIELDPTYVSAHRNLGIIYQQRGEYRKAIAAYQAVTRSDPENVEAHLSLARLYLREEAEPQEALAHLRRVLAMAPDHPQAAPVKKLIDTLTTREKDVR